MPKVEFTDSFTWTDPRNLPQSTEYKAGMVEMVTTPCAEAAILAGKAKRQEAPAENDQSE